MKSAPSPMPRFSFPDGPNSNPSAGQTAAEQIAAEKLAAAPQKQVKPQAACDDDFCPYCQQPLPGSGVSVLGLLMLGVKQLIGAIRMIVVGIFRCLRFSVAGALCLVGLVGSCCFGLASRIAHRDDRRFLFRR